MEAFEHPQLSNGARRSVPRSAQRCLLRNIDRISYADALALQRQLHARCAAGDLPGVLLLLEHDPVITTGVRTADGSLLCAPEELQGCGIELVETDRGGDATYHGPGQLVGYPILRLRQVSPDLTTYLRRLEDSVIETLAHFGLAGERNGPAGVWVGDRKICSIGIAVRKWVTYHGFALNVNTDLSHFTFINPCGLKAGVITSMAQLLGAPLDMADVGSVYARCFAETFGLELTHWHGDTP